MAIREPRDTAYAHPVTQMLTQLPETFMNLYMLSQQLGFQSTEAALNREAATTAADLGFARQLYVGQQERKALLEEQVIEIGALPAQEKRSGTEDLLKMTTGNLFEEIKQNEDYMSSLQSMRSEQKAGIRDVKNIQDRFADIIEDQKDEAAKYVISGSLEVDPATGLPIGTGEWEAILEKLKTGTEAERLEYEKFRDEAYISGIQSSLRSLEDARNLQVIDIQFEASRKQIDTADAALRESNYSFAIKMFDEFEGSVGDIYKNTALSTQANFRYIADGVPYKITDLTLLAAGDPDQFIDIKKEFLEDSANHAIAAEAESFIAGLQTATAMKIDASEYVVRFQAAAYNDFLLLQDYQARLAEEGLAEGKTMQEMFASLPDRDPTKIELKRLKAKVDGYKRLGLYLTSPEMLDRAAAVVELHNIEQAKRLAMDIDDSERISREGLGLPPVEDFYPSQQEYMTPKMHEDLEVSLAALAASGTGDLGDDPDTAKTLGEKAMSIPLVAGSGWTVSKINETLYNQGVDIYNLGALPLNYLTYMLTGYNPGYSGRTFMEPYATATGLTEETLKGFPLGFHDIGPVGGDLFGTPPGKFSWEEVDESLNNITKP